MLKTRVITALVLVSLLLPSLFWLSQSFWALLVAAFIGVAAWEWGALLGWKPQSRVLLGGLVATVCSLLSLLDPSLLEFRLGSIWVAVAYGLSTVFWLILMPFWLRNKWAIQGMSGLLVGAVVLIPTWLAMVQLRALGAAALLGIFAVVWMADIAAYFSGRALGKHKLAPTISPGKTWEGAIGACIGVVIYGLVVRQIFDIQVLSLPLWIVVLFVITGVSIVGDLFESLLKRKAGIKDSSNILPGHGGVLDRIDSLTSTLPVVSLFLLLVQHSS